MPSRALQRYRTDIDGLRALAILFVLTFHFEVLSPGHGGFLGVDIFFVISGYLISQIILRDLGRGDFSIRKFYLRRIRRLGPAFFVVLAASLIAGYVLLFPSDFQSLAKETFFAQLFVANVHYWQTINYFGLLADGAFLLHTWSLSVEEQFYLFFPIILMVIWKLDKRAVFPSLLIGALASFALNLMFVEHKPEATFYLLPPRAWELCVGALIPLASASIGNRRLLGELISIGGLLLIIVSVVAYEKTTPFPGTYALLPTIGTALLIASASQNATALSRALSHPVLRYVGNISYPLYLVHWPVNIFAKQYFPDYDATLRMAMLLLSCALAMLIYHLVEKPIRFRKVFRKESSLGYGYLTGLAVSIVAVAAIGLSHGAPGRFPVDVVEMAARVSDKAPPLRECEYTGSQPTTRGEYCRIGDPDTEPNWFVYGDSHAWAAYHAFDTWLKANGESAFFAFRNSCVPISGIALIGGTGECIAFNDAILDYIGEHDAIENVFLVSAWREVREGRTSDDPSHVMTIPEAEQLLRTRLLQTTSQLGRLGKRVVIWEPVPGARRSVPLSLASQMLGRDVPPLNWSEANYHSMFDYFFAALGEAHVDRRNRFSPADLLCRDGTCAVEIDGVPVYIDKNHLTDSLAGMWAAELSAQLNPHPKRPALF